MIFEYKGIKVNYELYGEGNKGDLLLLHGWGCNIDTMAVFKNRFENRKRVFAIDFPGFGKSDYPNGVWDVSEYMEMTAEFICRNGLKKPDIICHSFGGRVTIKLASKHPKLINKIIFVDGAGVKKKRSIAFHIRTYIYKLCKKTVKNKALYNLLKIFGIDADERIKNAGSEDYKALPDNMKGTFVKVVNEDLTKYLRDIKSPSLLIYGENDDATPVSLAKIMEKKIPDAGLVVINGAGHFSFLDSPAQVLSVCDVFLKD